MLAALVLLATLLAGLLVAKSGAERQWSRAEQRLRAVAATDALLERWLSVGASDSEGVTGVPIEDTGVLPGVDGWRWETSVLDHEPAAVLHCQVVRLSIIDPAHGDNPVLLSVDVLTPLPPEVPEVPEVPESPEPQEEVAGPTDAIDGDTTVPEELGNP